MPFPCRSHVVPLPCRSAKGLDCVTFPFDLHSAAVFDSHIPCRSPAMPRICLSRQGRGKVTAANSVERYVGDLPAFGVFLLPRGVPGSLSEACQSQMQVASIKQNNV